MNIKKQRARKASNKTTFTIKSYKKCLELNWFENRINYFVKCNIEVDSLK